ncbi:hypothetical protein [Burkholderia sp. L27(2015)]|nr:hypothetical protein [Burkholderia sp. L27(2015)]
MDLIEQGILRVTNLSPLNQIGAADSLTGIKAASPRMFYLL